MGVTMTGDDPMTLYKTLLKAGNDDVEEILIMEGMRTYSRMRSEHDYTDRSGALTSSMGCVVSNGGNTKFVTGFDLAGSGTAGQDAGRRYAEQLAKEIQNGIIALIVLAGEDYGGYLESENRDWKKGSPYKVVQFTEVDTRSNIEKQLEKLF